MRWIIAGTLCLASLPSAAQDIDYRNTKAHVTYTLVTVWRNGSSLPDARPTLAIEGEINSDAATLVKAYYDNAMKDTKPSLPPGLLIELPVELDSAGGDVDAAINIGRFLRSKLNVSIHVKPGAHCASACILVLAGGLHRHMDGYLGIHRPFLNGVTSGSLTNEEIKLAATKTQERLRSYFREMNVSERLADDMMMIPSSQMKWLTPKEITAYGLGGDDPVLTETLALREAQRYGLSRVEYERRLKQGRERCSPSTTPDVSDCRENIMRKVGP
jgi:ATP-dependent protease ClpP protease subunit